MKTCYKISGVLINYLSAKPLSEMSVKLIRTKKKIYSSENLFSFTLITFYTYSSKPKWNFEFWNWNLDMLFIFSRLDWASSIESHLDEVLARHISKTKII